MDFISDDKVEEFHGEGTTSKGYCHFNDNSDKKDFTISMRGHSFNLYQEPGNRTLGHGAVVWDSSVVFSKYMDLHPQDFSSAKLEGKRLIELGSGCGLAGLAFMLRGCCVTLTDLPEVVATVTTINANKIFKQLTSQGYAGLGVTLVEPICQPLDWTTMELEHLSPPFDYVLLTDCVFSAALVPHLIRVIRHCCFAKSTVICCHEIRDEEANTAFVEQFREHFNVKRIARSKLDPDFSNDLIEVLVAKPMRASKLCKRGGEGEGEDGATSKAPPHMRPTNDSPTQSQSHAPTATDTTSAKTAKSMLKSPS